MKHFVQYHNSEHMKGSVSALSEPKIFTDKSVRNLSSNVVWLISGEGNSPKDFYLAAVFKVNRIAVDCYDHPDFRNSAYGDGHIFGETILLNGKGWFETLKAGMANFSLGLSEISDPLTIDELRKAAGPHAI